MPKEPLTSLHFLPILAIILKHLAVWICLVVPTLLRVVHQNLFWLWLRRRRASGGLLPGYALAPFRAKGFRFDFGDAVDLSDTGDETRARPWTAVDDLLEPPVRKRGVLPAFAPTETVRICILWGDLGACQRASTEVCELDGGGPQLTGKPTRFRDSHIRTGIAPVAWMESYRLRWIVRRTR